MHLNFYQTGSKSHDKMLIIRHLDVNKILKIPVYSITNLGIQIFGLSGLNSNSTFLHEIGIELVKQGFDVTIADWRNSEQEGKLDISNLQKIENPDLTS